jgi:hypothetical protein
MGVTESVSVGVGEGTDEGGEGVEGEATEGEAWGEETEGKAPGIS